MGLHGRLLTEEELYSAELWNRMGHLEGYGVFSHPVFIRNWWRSFGKDKQLAAVELLDGDRTVCFLPMFVADQPQLMGILTVRDLRFFMDEFLVSIPKAPLLVDPACRGRMSEFLQTAVDIARAPAHRLRIERVYLGPLSDPCDLPMEQAPEEEAVIRLSSRRADIFEGMPSNTACNIRRRLRTLDRTFGEQWGTEIVRPNEAIVRDFVNLKIANWNHESQCAFQNPDLVEFISRSFTDADNAACLICRIQEKIVGMDLMLTSPDEVFSYNTCYDDNYRVYGVGRLLTFKIMEAYAQEKESFSLGLGDQKYKLDWGIEVHHRYRVCLWLSAAKRALYNAGTGIKGILKKKSGGLSAHASATAKADRS